MAAVAAVQVVETTKKVLDVTDLLCCTLPWCIISVYINSNISNSCANNSSPRRISFENNKK